MKKKPPIEYFNEVYSRVDRLWGADKENRYSVDPDDHPRSLISQSVLRLAARRPPGQALDLGAGEGSDSIRLAKLGYQVKAVDASWAATRKISKFAEHAGVSIDVVTSDVHDYDIDRLYDFILCNGLLHYIADKKSLITRIQNATAVGGYNVISAWSSYTPVPEGHRDVLSYCDAEDGLISRLYRDWPKELLYLERDKLETNHLNLGPHRHSYIKLIAVKPTA